ncbi:TSP2-like protein [Mya arenaria]|uniref:TSP2-like protein n=1 Tax=Mya arenaria TaxID=6604 RepID=A0ABY7DEL2_MYAAR|nr:TSP2-like protein [Mya arenaria]
MEHCTSTPTPVGSGPAAKRNLSLSPSEMDLPTDNKKSRPHESFDISSIPEHSTDTTADVSPSIKLSQHDITEHDTIKSENNFLKVRVSELESRVDHSEQYSRRNGLRISGIKEAAGEVTDDIVISMVSDLGGSISLDEIDRSHRVGKRYVPGSSQGSDRSARTIRPRDIIVKFTSYRSRQKLFNIRANAKGKELYNKVFINEDLSRARSNVFFKARLLARKGQIQSAWTSDGTILLRDNDMNVHRVTKANDLLMFENSTVLRPIPQQQSYASVLSAGSQTKLQQRERHCLSGAGSLAPGNCGHDAAVVFLPCDCNNQGGCHDNYTSCQTSYCSTYEAWSLTNCQATCGHCNPAGWGAWSAMSSCSVTCGTGTMTRHRNCLGTDCSWLVCVSVDPVNGGWSPWSQFSQCSQSCGFGVRARSRHCDSPAPQGTGLFCIGESIQREACNTEVCPGRLTYTCNTRAPRIVSPSKHRRIILTSTCEIAKTFFITLNHRTPIQWTAFGRSGVPGPSALSRVAWDPSLGNVHAQTLRRLLAAATVRETRSIPVTAQTDRAQVNLLIFPNNTNKHQSTAIVVLVSICGTVLAMQKYSRITIVVP